MFTVADEPGTLVGALTPDKREWAKTWLKEAVDGDAHGIFVAESESGVVGSLWVVAGEGLGEVKLNVLRDWRSRGVGQAMLEAAEKFAVGRGYRKLWLRVYADNQRAIALYERIGYEIEGRQRAQDVLPDGRLLDVVLMGKLL